MDKHTDIPRVQRDIVPFGACTGVNEIGGQQKGNEVSGFTRTPESSIMYSMVAAGDEGLLRVKGTPRGGFVKNNFLQATSLHLNNTQSGRVVRPFV